MRKEVRTRRAHVGDQRHVLRHRSMRILAVSHAYPRRGATSHGVFVHRLHQGLVAQGHHVEVLQRGDWGPPWPFSQLHASWRESRRERAAFLDEVDGIRLHHPLTVRPRPSRFFASDSWEIEARTAQRFARGQTRSGAFDAVLAHFLVPDGYHALAVGETLGIPVVAMAWGDDVHAWPTSRPDWAEKLRHVLQSADAVVACSERMANDANEWIPVPRGDWHVVYGGVDFRDEAACPEKPSARQSVLPADVARHIPDDANIALVLAQPCVAKGYVELLDAWSRLEAAFPDWFLLMAGGLGGDLDIRAELTTRGLVRTFWLGPQAPDRIPTLLAACDAFVLPSHNEGLSLSVLEAMASGLPTITTDVGGHAEVITDSAEGWLIPAKDTTALLDALRQLMSDKTERQRRGMNGKSAARRIGTPAENAARLLRVLEAAVHRSHRTQTAH